MKIHFYEKKKKFVGGKIFQNIGIYAIHPPPELLFYSLPDVKKLFQISRKTRKLRRRKKNLVVFPIFGHFRHFFGIFRLWQVLFISNFLSDHVEEKKSQKILTTGLFKSILESKLDLKKTFFMIIIRRGPEPKKIHRTQKIFIP